MTPPPVDFAQFNYIFSGGGISVTFTPQDGSGAQTIDAIIMPPGMQEEIMGGTGTAALRLWVDLKSLSPQPQGGDQFTVGPTTYVVTSPDAEPVSTGGAVLKLRKQ
jgi:hypothetical protein